MIPCKGLAPLAIANDKDKGILTIAITNQDFQLRLHKEKKAETSITTNKKNKQGKNLLFYTTISSKLTELVFLVFLCKISTYNLPQFSSTFLDF